MYGIVNYFYNFISRKKTQSLTSDDSVEELEEELRALEEVGCENIEPCSDEKTDSVPDNSETNQDKCTKQSLPEICQYRVGTVTKLLPDYGIIDEKYQFDYTKEQILNLQEGVRVNYVVFRNSTEENWRVHKILCIVDEGWDGKEEGEDKPEVLKKTGAIDRSIIGQVESRKERDVLVNPNIKFCLDNIESDFIPLKGDWIVIHALVEVDENVQDFAGDILSVRSITPLRTKVLSGFVTEWDSNKAEGKIEHIVFFTKEECEPGYNPEVEDAVTIEAIESTQGLCSWRALSVVCLSGMDRKLPGEKTEEHKIRGREPDNSVSLRHGIQVPRHLNFGIMVLGESKELGLEISNVGMTQHYLLRGKFHGKKSESQMTLLSYINSDTIISASQKVIFRFRANAKFLGHSTEMFVFTFRGFKMTCYLHINVNDKFVGDMIKVNRSSTMKELRMAALESAKSRVLGKRTASFMPGVQPIKPPAFIPVRFSQFQVPIPMWKTILGEDEDVMLEREAVVLQRVQDKFPVMAEELTPKNYSTRFHLLLHLEEIEATLLLNKFDMKNVALVFAGEFLSLEVPGLSEKRPSLMVGDKVVVQSSSQLGVDYEGFIHKVCAMEVLLKFHQKFHSSYSGEECSVHFVLSRGPIRRCHVAVDLALKHLGEHVLFPRSVLIKEPQVNLLDEHGKGEARTESKATATDSKEKNEDAQKDVPKGKRIVLRNGAPVYTASGKQYLPSRDPPKIITEPIKLKWINTSLNYYQKEAVRNALKGEARPLPYVIFGPPGTGKTLTLVETILQIYKLLPDSRILVATPSNSSANLIAERLLLSKILAPGDLVRLAAFHCLEEGTIPESLLPYCTTCDLKACTPRESNPVTLKLKISSNAVVLGRHRITVGTCIALGQLYSMGFPSGHFTHVCVDEAGQATEPEIMIPLGFLHKDWGQAILAGDPLQLGPVVTSRVSIHYGLAHSYLQRLLECFPYQRDPCGFSSVGGYNPKLITRLVMNYRSLPEILTLPSSLFYDSQLQPQVTYDNFEGALVKKLEPFLPKRDTPFPPSLVFHGVRGVNYQESDCPSWFNPQELMQVIYYLKDFFDSGLVPDDIGIITPYQKQVQKLRSLLTQLELPLPKIGSVEEFQGQERLVVIMSAVRSTVKHVSSDIRHSLGFVACPARLNVALTRARALLIVIGNPHVLSRDPYWRKTLAYCVENDAYIGSDLPRDFIDMAWETCNQDAKE